MKLEKTAKFIFSFLIIGLIFSIGTIATASNVNWVDSGTGSYILSTGTDKVSIGTSLNITGDTTLAITSCALLGTDSNGKIICSINGTVGTSPASEYLLQMGLYTLLGILTMWGTITIIKKLL